MNTANRITSRIALRSIVVMTGDGRSDHPTLESANAVLLANQATRLCDPIDVTVVFEDDHEAAMTMYLSDTPDIAAKFESTRRSVAARLRDGFDDSGFGRNMEKSYLKLDAALAAFFAKYSLGTDDVGPVDILRYWKDRVDAALAAMNGVLVEFSTSLQDRSDENAIYHGHSGQYATIAGLEIDPESTGCDEESLPFLTLKFADGVQIRAFEEETFSHSLRRHALAAVVAGGFAVARELGFDGPYHLDREGTDEQKLKFVSDLAGFSVEECSQAHNTPAAYRTKAARKA